MKHTPTGAFSPVPITISRSRSDRAFQPGCLRPESGQPRQVVSVNDDGWSRTGAVSMRGHVGRHPANPPASNAEAYLGGATALLINAEATRHRTLPQTAIRCWAPSATYTPTSSGAGTLTRTYAPRSRPDRPFPAPIQGPGRQTVDFISPFRHLSTLTACPGKPKTGCTYPMSGTT